MATVGNITLQEESTTQQRTLPTTLATRSVTGSRSAGSLNKAKDAHKKPKSQSQHQHGGRRRADEVGVSEGDPFDEVMIHA